MKPIVHRVAFRDEGQIGVFAVVITVTTIMFAGLVLDGGLALAAKSRALGEAQEAARAGAQAVDVAEYRRDGDWSLMPSLARQRAEAYLAVSGGNGRVFATATNVSVIVSARQRTRLLRLFGVEEFTVTATGQAHAVRGPTVRDP